MGDPDAAMTRMLLGSAVPPCHCALKGIEARAR
jgi:hypothetical protein